MGSAKTDFIIRRRIRRQPEGCYHGHMWLGVDVGTGGSRALLVDERGRVRAGYTALHEDIEMAHPQWAEQRPQNWWEAVVEAVRGVLASWVPRRNSRAGRANGRPTTSRSLDEWSPFCKMVRSLLTNRKFRASQAELLIVTKSYPGRSICKVVRPSTSRLQTQ